MLRDGYEEMLFPEKWHTQYPNKPFRRNFKVFFEISKCRYKTKGPKCPQYGVSDADLNKHGLKVPQEWHSIIEHLFILKDPTVIQEHAKLLFQVNTPEEIQENFRNRVLEIAESYFEARSALRELFEKSIEFLQVLNKPSVSEKLHDFNKDELIDRTARLCSEVINSRYLLAAIDSAKMDKNLNLKNSAKLLEAGLEEHILNKNLEDFRKTPRKKWDIRLREWNNLTRFQILDNALRLSLVAHQDSLTEILKDIDREFIHNFNFPKFTNSKGQKEIYPYVDNLSSKVQREYGIIRDLSVDRDEENLFNEENLKRAFNLVREASSGAGLERGRLMNGLNKLIEDYTDQEYTSSQTPQLSREQEGTAKALDRLLTALVYFAQKVLFVANYGSLLEKKKSPSCEYDYGRDTSVCNKSDASIREFTNVLQAVGNSILVQVDSLRQGEAYQELLKQGRNREIKASEWAYDENAAQFFNEILEKISDDLSTVDKELKELSGKVNNIPTDSTDTINSKAEPNTPSHTNKNEVANTALSSKHGNEVVQNKSEQYAALFEILYQDENVDWGSYIKNLEIGIKVGNADWISGILKIIQEQESNENTFSGETHVIRAHKLADARTMLESPEFQKEIAPLVANFGGNEDFFGNALKNYLREKYLEDKEKIIAKGNVATETTKKDILVENTNNIHPKDHLDLEAQKALISNAKQKAEGRQTQLLQAKQVIEPLRQKILDSVKSAKLAPTGTAVVSQLLGFLHSDLSKEADPNSKNAKILKNAIGIVEELPSLTPPSGFTQEAKDAKEVWDNLIAFLRQDHLKAVRKFGETSEPAKKAADTLRAALNHRASFIFLRPAMAYLRTSFPSTSLQEDAPLAWRNLLSEHGLHQLPFASTWEKQTMQTQLDIDKQFWQNVNRIRVAGAGNTNYVVAKDDIGNWYVKEMAAHPDDIFKSMGNLALFGMGTQLNPGLLSGGPVSPSQNPLPPSPVDKGSPGADTANIENSEQGSAAFSKVDSDKPVTALEKQFRLFDEQYRDKTGTDYKELKVDVQKIKGEIEKGWAGNPKTSSPAVLEKLKNALQHTQDPLIEDSQDSQHPEKDPAIGTKVLSAIAALGNFKSQVKSNILLVDLEDNSNGLNFEQELEITEKDLLQAKIKFQNESNEFEKATNRLKEIQVKVKGLTSNKEIIKSNSSSTEAQKGEAEGRLKEAQEEQERTQEKVNDLNSKVETANQQLIVAQNSADKFRNIAEVGHLAQKIASNIILTIERKYLGRRSSVVNELQGALNVIQKSVGE